MLVLTYARANGLDVMPERVSITCDVCHKRFTSLAAAWLGYARPARPGARVAPRWLHKTCAQAQPPPDGTPEHLWRVDHALYSLVKGLLKSAEIPLAARQDRPRNRHGKGAS